MRVQYHPEFIKKLKSVDVRVRKRFRKQIDIFQRDHLDPRLNNHELQREYRGYRSIDVDNDYRAVYEEIGESEGDLAYFFRLGTHKELYETKIIKIRRK